MPTLNLLTMGGRYMVTLLCAPGGRLVRPGPPASVPHGHRRRAAVVVRASGGKPADEGLGLLKWAGAVVPQGAVVKGERHLNINHSSPAMQEQGGGRHFAMCMAGAARRV